MIRKLILLGFAMYMVVANTHAQDDLGKVLVSAEEMPVWKSCSDNEDKVTCTKDEMGAYILRHLKYPRVALVNNVEGTVIISCIISRTGKVVEPRILRDIGDGCGTEALRVIQNMPIWQPAKNEGTDVSVVYNIEVSFEASQYALAKGNGDDAENIVYEEPVKPRITPNDPSPIPDDVQVEEQYLPADYEETAKGRVYTRVAQMPYFPGCDNLKNKSKEKRQCSNDNLIQYLSTYLSYPEEARAKSIEGIVYVTFIVNEDGSVSDPQVTRDIGGGCGEEAIRVVSTMANWEPGMEKGQPVKTKMSLPVRFFLSSGAAGKYRIHWGAIRTNTITEDQVLNAMTDELVVRNIYGDDITISTLNVAYEKGNSFKEAKSNGDITLEVMRLLRKAKSGGKLVFMATVQEKGELIDVFRVFKVTK